MKTSGGKIVSAAKIKVVTRRVKAPKLVNTNNHFLLLGKMHVKTLVGKDRSTE